jgi:hypothetical protein
LGCGIISRREADVSRETSGVKALLKEWPIGTAKAQEDGIAFCNAEINEEAKGIKRELLEHILIRGGWMVESEHVFRSDDRNREEQETKKYRSSLQPILF